MMGADESATLVAMRELRHDIFEPLIARHSGRVVKRMGDGWLVEFAAARDAVNCAISVQEQLETLETIKMRIGVHIGDVVLDEEGDIHGDGVNIAARLEAVADPKGIAISDQVYQSLDGTIAPVFTNSGQHELKNIRRPVLVWAWPTAANVRTLEAPVDENKVPIILLEQLNLGGDTEKAEDVAMELQSGLLDALSSRSGVRVTTQSQQGKSPAYILKGRCSVSGTRCRLHLSITDVASGETCWSTKIDDDSKDLFGFVDDTISKISAAIRISINASAGLAYLSEPDETLSVQQLLSKAAVYMHHFDAKNAKLSCETMSAAIELAPDDPMVLAMQAYAMMQTVPLAIERAQDIDVDAAMSFADRSVYQGSNVDFVFHNRARMRLWLRADHAGCRNDAERALSINPGYHLAAEDLGLQKIFGGQISQGVAEFEAIMKQMPEQPITPYRLSILGIGYALMGDMTSAQKYALDGYERKPLVKLHALSYAAAASCSPEIVGSSEFQNMMVQHDLSTDDASRFPFATEEDRNKLAAFLHRASLRG